MPEKLIIEQAANGFIVNEHSDVSSHCAVQATEPHVFNNIHDMYSWMGEYFKEGNRESHSEK
jgi:hypothetical protein